MLLRALTTPVVRAHALPCACRMFTRPWPRGHVYVRTQPVATGYSSVGGADRVCRAHAQVAVARLADMVQAAVLHQAQERAEGITLRVLRA